MHQRKKRAKQSIDTIHDCNDHGSYGSFSMLLCRTVFAQRLSNVQALFMQFAQALSYALKTDFASLWLCEGEAMKRALIINRPHESISDDLCLVADLKFGDLVCENSETMIINDIRSDTRFIKQNFVSRADFKSYISHPIKLSGQLIGVVHFMRRGNLPFEESDAYMLNFYCELLDIAIDHCSLSGNALMHWTNMIERVYQNSKGSGCELNMSDDEEFLQLKPIWLLSDDLPKGIYPITLAKVFSHIQRSNNSVSSIDISESSGISLASARRYLNYLYESGQLDRNLVYTHVGRPSYLYSLAK